MKKDIHPKYMDCTVTCGCGATWATRSTVRELKVEICSSCHPFYTGAERVVDSLGRVDRFTRKFGKDYFAQAPVKRKRKQTRA